MPYKANGPKLKFPESWINVHRAFTMTKRLSNDCTDPTKQLIVLAVPSVNESYYKKYFNDIIEFDINFARIVRGRDNIIILADRDTIPYIRGRVPDDIILKCSLEDIWMRDFSTVIPNKMIAFMYDRTGYEKNIQRSFQKAMKRFDVKFDFFKTLKVDGGNVVENPSGNRVIMSKKVFQRNKKSKKKTEEMLKEILGVSEIAFIPMDEEKLGHADGQVMFAEDKEVLICDYLGEESFLEECITEIEKAFGKNNVNITTVPTNFDERKSMVEGGFGSANGIYVNSVVTNKFIYVPKFGDEKFDDSAFRVIQSRTRNRQCVQVDCSKVGFMGGNCRCLSWQVTGENAKTLILEARK